MKNMWRGLLVTMIIAGAVWGSVQADQMAPWQAANEIHTLTLEAQQALYAAARTATSDDATAPIRDAQTLYDTALHDSLSTVAPHADDAIETGLDAALNAAISGDTLQLAGARGQIWTGLLWASYEATLHAVEQGDYQAAEDWLRLREYRQATKVSIVYSPASNALNELAAGDLDGNTALLRVGNELRDAYFFRLRDALSEVELATDKQFAARAAEWASQASGYFAILRDDFTTKLGADVGAQVDDQLTGLENAIRQEDWAAAGQYLTEVRAAMGAYEPVELSAAEIEERGQTLYLFINLVYVEYKDGVRGGKITNEIEYREAITFRDQAQVVFEELRPAIARNDPAAADRLAALLEGMKSTIQSYGDKNVVQDSVDESLAIIEQTLAVEASPNDISATFVAVYSLLNDIVLTAEAGDYTTAENTRVQAYAMFDAGPELRLFAFSPALVEEIDGLFWSGYGDHVGLAEALASEAPPAEINATRKALVSALEEAQIVIGDTSSAPLAIITNTAIIVFREGLEAVVILAALLASMVHRYRQYRSPIALGVVLAFLATAITWVIAQSVLASFSQYGERLEAVVSLIAIGVLLLITNWFFHKVYWTDWLARFHRQKSKALKLDAGQYIALVTLGFTSVYREGFETVLFLQALTLDAGPAIVLQGVALGMVGVLLAGYLTFRLQKHLPYMTMMVVTGILIGGVLVMLVGNTVRVMQTVGWLSITPIEGLHLPYALGLWFGIYATWEGILAQIGAAGFVLSSYYLAEYLKKRERLLRVQQQTTSRPG